MNELSIRYDFVVVSLREGPFPLSPSVTGHVRPAMKEGPRLGANPGYVQCMVIKLSGGRRERITNNNEADRGYAPVLSLTTNLRCSGTPRLETPELVIRVSGWNLATMVAG